MLELIATLILLVIVIQFMAIVDEHKRFEKLERNVAEIINNELKVYKLKHNGIELKNIDLSNISMTEQWDKVAEEDIEFEESDDIFEMISEFWDTVQARLGILQKLGVDAKIVMKYYPEHLKKLENRPRTKEIE
ncbi:hypothetical protein [Clostridium cadaveris]|uniref:hypothetical protein n=1 Tax=Clostridium cadaveris TaxID=1529 RepID=UPI0015B65E16|nr:hypothetical protein [Clostridium cadaveris]NWK12996.1 hypothetical protein [Clostridium cadaveris]